MSPAGRCARLSVLMFHRVRAEPDPLFPNELDGRRFESMCGWLRAWFNVLALDEAVRRLRSKTLPARALSITFDDGYADNHAVALPILQRYGLQATFFIATGFLDGGRMWNDTVIEAIRESPRPVLDLQGLALAHLGTVPIGTPVQKRQAIDAVIRATKYLPGPVRDEAVRALAHAAGSAPRADLMMTARQVVELRRAGMQIGAHTVTHPILAGLDAASIRAEMSGSKCFLEDLLGEEVALFAYPNGKPGDDFTPVSVAIAREVGFEAAVTTAPGAAGMKTDPWQLPRFSPWDRSRMRFGARLLKNLRES